MRTSRVTFTLALCFVFSLCSSALGQQPQTFTWSSKDCSTCESSILDPGWYSDGSGLFMEAIPRENALVTAGIAGMGNYFAVAVGFGIEGTGALTVNPMKAIRLESDSSPNMVLFPLRNPDLRSFRGTVVDKKQLKDKPVNVTADKTAGGYLVFAADNNASRVIVVVDIGNETFRFPFVRNPSARAKFGDPDASPALIVGQPSTKEDGRLGYVDCGKMFSFVALFSSPDTANLVTIEHLPCGEPVAILGESNEQFTKVRTQANHDGFVNSSLLQAGISPAKATANSGQQAPTALTFARSDQLICKKNISFAVAGGGQIVPRMPDFAQKWVAKNQKKYAGLCFSQVPDSRAANYLLVFSTSQSAFNGIYPTVRTNTSTSTNMTPVSGSGTVTDNYGGMWNYTYDGTVTTTTTTTTTTEENLPYRDTSNTLYLHAYSQNGSLVSERWRTVTTRQGGDAGNTLGYNLGAALVTIHFKEHLLRQAVEDVTKGPK